MLPPESCRSRQRSRHARARRWTKRWQMLAAAKKPVILAGVELHRFGLTDLAIKLAETLNIPIAADLLSKSAVAENHPLYLGVYGGAMCSDQHVRDYVESADCVLMLGTFITDMNMGIYTAKLDRSRTILATTESINVGYPPLRRRASSRDYLNGSSLGVGGTARSPRKKRSSIPNPHVEPKPLTKIGTDRPADDGGCDPHRRRCIWTKTAAWSATSATPSSAPSASAPPSAPSSSRRPITCRWASPSPPASASRWRTRSLRPFVLVGDGAFQMTGTELSTAVRLGLKPIILDPQQRRLRHDAEDPRRHVQRHQPVELRQNLRPGRRRRIDASRNDQGRTRRRDPARAWAATDVQVIDVRVPRDDMSPQLANMTAEWRGCGG